MIPTSYTINSYEEIPEFSSQQVQQMMKNGEKIVFYDELVINVSQFNHPGGIQIMSPFISNPSASIKDIFWKYSHSHYAEVLLCVNTIGKMKFQKNKDIYDKSQNLSGKSLFETVDRYNQFKLHKRTLEKIDFSKPIYSQVHQLSIEQKQCLIEIPTFMDSPDKIKFKPTLMEQRMYTNSFWTSTICFQIFIVIAFICLMMQPVEERIFIGLLPYFLYGLVKWTFLEYYFHRFLLHYDLTVKPQLSDHLMHHAFPNMKNKLALSVSKIFIYMVGFYLVYSLFLLKTAVIAILLGTLIGLTLYDITHYYFHFGPQINIPVLVSLRRNHLKHHYRDSNKGFGVSTTIWDKLCGTEHKR